MQLVRQTKKYTFAEFREKPYNMRNVLKAQEMLKLMRFYGIKSLHDVKTVSSINRTKRNIFDIVEHNIEYGSSFITLTYAENMQDYKKSMREFNNFIVKMRFHYGDIKYICIKELQDRGAIHYHLVWFNAVHVDDERMAELWSNGFINIKRIYDLSDVSRIGGYVSKYLTKTKAEKDIKKGFRKFTKSNNLVMSTTTKITHEEYLDLIENNDNYCITKTRRDTGFTAKHILMKKDVDILPF